MKITRLLVLVAFLGISCSVAVADGTDPIFKLGGGGGSIPLTSDTFSFTVNQADAVAGLVNFDFINFTGATIMQLNLDAPAGFLFSCNPAGDPYFNNCSPQAATAGPTTLSFFGLDGTHFGIPTATHVFCDDEEDSDECSADVPASDFLITVNVADMPVGSSFDVQGTLVPIATAEPSTLLMVLAAGLGFLAVKRSGFAI